MASEWNRVRDWRDYYDGDHPVMLSHRQAEYLGSILTESAHVVAFNLCRVIVDVLRERVTVQGFAGEDAPGTALAETCWEWWQDAQMDRHQIEVHKRGLRDGKSYLIVEWDTAKRQPVWVPNRRYDGDTGVTFHKDQRGQPVLAAKYWTVDDILSEKHGERRRTIYLPDRIIHYKADGNAQYGWTLIDPLEGQPVTWWTDTLREGGQPLGLPVIEFENPDGNSELLPVIGLQNALNKLILDLLAAGDTTAFQILAISYTGPMDAAPADDEGETDEAHTDELKIAPGRAVELYDGSTMTAIPPGDLSQLIKAIDTVVGFIAGATRTPQYYLRPFGGADVPSGEALKQLETALVSRAKERAGSFGDAWVLAMRVATRLAAAMGGRNVPDAEADMTTTWADPNVKNELYAAQTAEAEKRLGVPDEWLWKSRLGYSPTEIGEIKRMKARADASALANVLQAVGLQQTQQQGAASGQQPVGGASGNGQVGQAQRQPVGAGNGTDGEPAAGA
ncbi:MAG: phage portal protein [Chloroflexota bacterium]